MAIKFPCELVGQYFLPALRAELTRYLVKEKKMGRKEAGKILGLTPAALCQYLKDKRGGNYSFSQKERQLVKGLADSLVDGKKSGAELVGRTCELCMEMRSNLLLCALHTAKNPGLKDCKVCLNLKK